MGKFREISDFMNAVKNDDIVQIREMLVMILKIYSKEYKNEFIPALEYAKSNSSFKFDVHEEYENYDNLSKAEQFENEYMDLMSNFSEARLDKVRILLTYKKELSDDFLSIDETLESQESEDITTKLNQFKKTLIIIGVVITLIVLYKLF